MPTYWIDYCDKPSAVYRLYARDGRLLYVGMALDPDRRIAHHRRKPWGAQIASQTVEWHPDRETAKTAERLAIHPENPVHNQARPRVETH